MFFARCVWFALWGGKFPFANSNTVQFSYTNGFYSAEAKPAKSGLLGWHFENKIEADNTRGYPAQTVIHIQPTDALVTTGIRDAANPSGGLVTSCAGFWVSTQFVPSKTVVSGNDVWNLPQWPMPVPTNFDDPANYWIYLGEMNC